MAAMDRGADSWSGTPHRSGRETAVRPVVSHNLRTGEGPIKDSVLRTGVRNSQVKLDKMVIVGAQQPEPMAQVNVQDNHTLTIVHNNKTPMTEVVPDAITTQAQELAVLKEDLAAQEALRVRERELKMAAEEEQRKTANNLRRAERTPSL